MLRSAKEAAEAAKEAARCAQESQRSEHEAAEVKGRERKALEQAHAEFERLAHEAAIAGALHVVVPGHRLDIDHLLRQGFIARRVQRRMSFEAHLQSLLRETDDALSHLADRLVVESRGITVVEDDILLHRNPLRSMLETLWRRGDIVPPADLDLVMALLRTLTAVDRPWLEQNRSRIGAVLRAFEELKAVDGKLHQVTWENRILGPSMQTGTYVTWESSGDGAGMAVAFCPERLKWLSVNWQELSSWIQQVIDIESAAGRFEATFTVLETDESQWIIESDSVTMSCSCGHPAVVMSEMQSVGYEVALMKSDPEPPDEKPRQIRWDEVALARLEDLSGCKLRVSWEP